MCKQITVKLNGYWISVLGTVSRCGNKWIECWIELLVLDSNNWNHFTNCRVSWGCRIHRLLLSKGVRPANECPGDDTKQFVGEAPVMTDHWRMQNSPSLPLLPGSLWSRVVAPDRALSMGQIELNCTLMINWIAWNRIVLTFGLRTRARLNSWKWISFYLETVIRLNWIVWNRTVLTFNCA